MATNENRSIVVGVIYDKPIKEGISKKGIPYCITTLVIELKSSWEDKEGKPHGKTDLVEFKLTKGVQTSLDNYSVGDPVAVSYSLGGKKFEGAKGVYYINEPICKNIKFSDLDSNGIRAGKKNTPNNSTPTTEAPEPLFEEFSDDDLPF